MKKLMPSEGLRLGCSSGSTRCVIAKNYVLGQPGGVTFSPSGMSPPFKGGREGLFFFWGREGLSSLKYLCSHSDSDTINGWLPLFMGIIYLYGYNI